MLASFTVDRPVSPTKVIKFSLSIGVRQKNLSYYIRLPEFKVKESVFQLLWLSMHFDLYFPLDVVFIYCLMSRKSDVKYLIIYNKFFIISSHHFNKGVSQYYFFCL